LKPTIIALLIFLTASAYSNSGYAQVYDSAEKAFKLSADSGLPVLLVFSGSDWCGPCIRFEKKILSDAVFQDFAKLNLIILNADFPQRKSLSAAIKSQNDNLAEKYNPNGVFPTIMLIYPGGKDPFNLSYNNQTSSAFIYDIKAHFRHEQRADSK
jgi:thiamine biosynthesis lipoprotein